MRDSLREAFSRFLNIPDYYHQPATPTRKDPRFDFRLMRRTPQGHPVESDLYAVAYLSHDNNRIRRSNDLTIEQRAALYHLWFSSNPDSFLLLERTPADENQVAIVGNTIILPLTDPVLERLQTGSQSVIDLRPADIAPTAQAGNPLLLDTWVLHNDYQDFSRFFSWPWRPTHARFGNALPLRHLATFWNPAGTVPLRLYAEPDSSPMTQLLERLEFQRISKTKIGHSLMRFDFPPVGPQSLQNVLPRRYASEVVVKMNQCASWPLVP